MPPSALILFALTIAALSGDGGVGSASASFAALSQLETAIRALPPSQRAAALDALAARAGLAAHADMPAEAAADALYPPPASRRASGSLSCASSRLDGGGALLDASPAGGAALALLELDARRAALRVDAHADNSRSGSAALLSAQGARGSSAARRIARHEQRSSAARGGASAGSRGAARGAITRESPASGLACTCAPFECTCTRACTCALLGDDGAILSTQGSLIPSPLVHGDRGELVNATEMHEPGYMFRCDCRFKVDASDADFDSMACGCQAEVCDCRRKCACAVSSAPPPQGTGQR